MAWSPFSFDCFDGVSLPDISTDNTIDAGIVTSETLADDDNDLQLFKSYQLTIESANPFTESDEILDDDIEECGSKCKKESDEEFDDDDEDIEESVFFSFGEHCGHCEEETPSNTDESELEDDNSEISPFEEADFIMLDISEAVLNDGEDDIIADDIDDMVDEDDEEIDANVEGIDEIEADIIDDEEDDLIDMAMEAEDE